MEQPPPPYSPREQIPPQQQQQHQGYEPLLNTDYPPQSTPYPSQQQAGYLPQKQYGGYQNQGYPQNPGYPPQNPGYPSQNPGYPPQGQGYVQQPDMFSSLLTNSTTTVVGQNRPQGATGVIPVVNDRMKISIISIFCGCPLIGIFALLKSYEAQNRYMAGDYAGAVASARKARNLAYTAFLCGFLLISADIAFVTAMATSSS